MRCTTRGRSSPDLAAALALGGDCLADIAVLREQPELAGPVASDPVVSRLARDLAAAGRRRALKAIRAARAEARERAWELAGDAAPGAGGGLVTIDLDATVVIAHSPALGEGAGRAHLEEDARFHPMTAWADHGPDGSGEPLAIVLRPGNAGSSTAADHIEATRLALAQLPRHQWRKALIRADSAGGTHEFLKWLTARSRRLGYSVGLTITGDIQDAIGKIPAVAPGQAYDRLRRATARRLGRRDHRHARPGRLARGNAGHRPQGAPAPRSAAAVHRHRRAPVHLPGHLHARAAAPGPGAPAPPPGTLRGPDPLRQGHRPAQPAPARL